MTRCRWIERAVAVVLVAGAAGLGVVTAPAAGAVSARSTEATPRACALLSEAELTGTFGDAFADGKPHHTRTIDSCTWPILPAKKLTEAALILTSFPSRRAAAAGLAKVVATKRSDGGHPATVAGLGDAAFFTAPYATKSGGINVSAMDARTGRVVVKLYYSPQHDPRVDDVATLRTHLEGLTTSVIQGLSNAH